MLSENESFPVFLHLNLSGVELFWGRAIEAEQLVRRQHQLGLLARGSESVAFGQTVS
jgi:hypothetical protein